MSSPVLERKPNIVIILADDMGYGDVGCYNSDSKIPTPNMDRLAKGGMIFTDAHSASAVCTPSRYGILTGRYCWRTSLKRQVLYSYEPPLIEPQRLTIAGMLKQAGYNTACIGKWHLGLGFKARRGKKIDFDRPMPWPEADRALEKSIDFSRAVEGGPMELGFDYFFGTSGCSTAQPPFAFIEGDRFLEVPSYYNEWFPNTGRPGMTAPDWDHKKVDTTFARKARQFIADNRQSEKPFFLYLAPSAPHEPCVEEVVPEFARRQSSAGPRGDLVWLFDWIVGQVIEALEQSGQINDTLIFVTSDNGALPGDRVVSANGEVVFHTYGHRSCGHWRGYKHEIWEGGHREPLIVHWPKRVKPGSRSSAVFCLNDLTATLGSLVGAEVPEKWAEDSRNMEAVLYNGEGSGSGRQDLIHHSQLGFFSIRKGPWKMIHGTIGSGAHSPGSREMPELDTQGQLYNLEQDPAEENNLFSAEPDVVRELAGLLEQYREAD